MQDHQSQRPPVYLLPPELLSNVFILLRTRKWIGKRVPAEVVLTHVSRTFRNAALNTTPLWSTIAVWNHRNSLDLAALYLERSGRLPLSLFVDLWGEDKWMKPAARESMINEVMTLLLPHAQRWYRLDMDVYYQRTFKTALFRLRGHHFPLLQSLSIDFDHRSSSPAADTWYSDDHIPLFTAPSLTHITMEVIRPLWTVIGDNVTALSLEERASRHTITDQGDLRADMELPPAPLLLSKLWNLTHLSISGRVSLVMQSEPIEISIPSLISLRCVAKSNPTEVSPGLWEFLIALSAPYLASIWIERVDSFGMHAIVAYLNQRNTNRGTQQSPPTKFPRLRYLTLKGQHIKGDSYRHLSLFLPSVTHLNLSYLPVYGKATDALKVNSPSGIVLWPALHTLVYKTVYDGDQDAIRLSLRELLASRIVAGFPLNRLLLDPDLYRVACDERTLNGSWLVEHVAIESWGVAVYDDPGEYPDYVWREA